MIITRVDGSTYESGQFNDTPIEYRFHCDRCAEPIEAPACITDKHQPGSIFCSGYCATWNLIEPPTGR